MRRFLSFVFVFFIFFLSQAQTLVMNEVSNGPSGTKEYVEFVVVDTNIVYNCVGVTNPPCIDIRGWIYDDNSGYHGVGGVAPGCIRFSNNIFWSCIPVGTIILIYNDQDVDLPTMPAIDTLMTDGNCRLVVPVNKVNWFDNNVTTPGALACSYPAAGWTPGGNWTSTGLANGGDCSRIVNLAGCEVFSVCWGTVNTNTLVYISGSATGKVFFFDNSLNNTPTNNGNWTNGSATVPNQQTPGAPNNTANGNWIHGMNNNCTPIQPMAVTFSTSVGSCPCIASATVSPTGSLPPFTYTWSPAPGSGQGTAIAGGLCTGTYSCFVQSSITKCTETVVINTTNNNTFSTTTASNTGSYCAGSTIQLNTPAATSYTWSGPGGFTSSLQNPTIGASSPTMSGTYTVQVSITTCTAQATTSITVNALPNATVSNNGPVCAGQPFNLSGGTGVSYLWNGPLGYTSTAQNPTIAVSSTTNSGTYMLTVTGANSCTNSANTSATINPLPISTASNNGPICIGSPLNLTGGGGGTYLWSGPNSFTANIQNPTIAVTTSLNTGLYTVTVTLAGCTNVATTSVVTTNGNTSATNTGPYCSGSTIQLNTPAATTYTWSGPGGFSSNSQNPSIGAATTTMSGTYSVNVSIGTCTAAATTSIIVNAVPIPTVSNSGPVCEGSLLSLNGNGGSTYLWNGPSGYTSTSPSPTIAVSTVSNSGTYTLVVTAANTCTGIATTNVLINPSPLATASVSNTCFGNTLNLSSNGGSTYFWLGPNSFTSTNQNPAIANASLTNVGVYTVAVTSSNSCVSTTTVMVNLQSSPTVTVASNGSCEGNTLSLTSGGGSIYVWSGPNSFTSSAQNPVISVASITNTGVYTVSVSNGSCANTGTVNVLINAAPALTASVNNVVLCADSTGYFYAIGSAGNYTWSGPAGFNSTSQNPVIPNVSESNEGLYTIVITDSKGCSASRSISVTIDPCHCTPFIPEGFSPNNDGAHDTFSITCIDGRKTKVEIYNRWGNLVYKENDYKNNWDGKTNNGLQVVGDDLPAGTYYYIVKVEDEEKSRTGFITLWR